MKFLTNLLLISLLTFSLNTLAESSNKNKFNVDTFDIRGINLNSTLKDIMKKFPAGSYSSKRTQDFVEYRWQKTKTDTKFDTLVARFPRKARGRLESHLKQRPYSLTLEQGKFSFDSAKGIFKSVCNKYGQNASCKKPITYKTFCANNWQDINNNEKYLRFSFNDFCNKKVSQLSNLKLELVDHSVIKNHKKIAKAKIKQKTIKKAKKREHVANF